MPLCDAGVRDASERGLAAAPIPGSAKFGRLEGYGPGSITIDTVARFKGLERSVIILSGLDACTSEGDRETLYVGKSRAKSLLFLCGTREACERVAGG